MYKLNIEDIVTMHKHTFILPTISLCFIVVDKKNDCEDSTTTTDFIDEVEESQESSYNKFFS